MNIENDIFKRMKIDFDKLVKYGFIKNAEYYVYSTKIMNDLFRVDIKIDNNGKVSGQVFDLDVDEEYTNFRIENQVGEFVNSVRSEYEKVLQDIAEKCFVKNYFITDQANRITKLIIEKFGDIPEFPWDDLEGSGVFRNPLNRKWYGLIMNIDRSKLHDGKGEVDILNVKLDEEEIKKLLLKKGYYVCYHMNKKKWITIVLDDTIDDQTIMQHLSESHEYTCPPKEWIVPTNPKYYDVLNCYNDSDTVIWKQSTDINVGDIIYMYVASPYSAILYKCQALEVNIPHEYSDENLTISRVMKLKLLKKYDKNKYTFDKLQAYGIKSIRGPRYMPKKLSQDLEKKNNE